MSIGVKGVNSLGGMVGFRLVLGLVEAGFFPGVMLLMSCWYKPAELAKRIALFYTASLVSGLLLYRNLSNAPFSSLVPSVVFLRVVLLRVLRARPTPPDGSEFSPLPRLSHTPLS